jgi:hypothetical protein
MIEPLHSCKLALLFTGQGTMSPDRADYNPSPLFYDAMSLGEEMSSKYL